MQDYKVKDITQAEFGRKEISLAETEMPGLMALRAEYKRKSLITMPIAGTIVWFCLGMLALFIPAKSMVLPVYIGTGSIFYLALFLSKFTGEKLLVKKEERNPFDSLFLYTLGMSWCAFAIAIPFGIQDLSFSIVIFRFDI